jgi:hypothetical protein
MGRIRRQGAEAKKNGNERFRSQKPNLKDQFGQEVCDTASME